MSDTIKAILVDDEESARNILSNLLKRYEKDIVVVDMCEDVESAVASIHAHKPDVVFLDIEMPNYSGLELIAFFDEVDFDIVFVTAYGHFAIKAFEIAAFDYLLKPIELLRLDNTIKNLIEKHQRDKDAMNYQILKETLHQKTVQKMVFPHMGQQLAVHVNEVVAIEANEAYSVIYIANGTQITVSKNLKHFDNLLSDNPEFFRIHKSWIVNYHHVNKYSLTDNSIFLTNSIEAKISKYKKAEFATWFENM